MKTVSVILTTYNSEKYLQRTLDSILTQNGINDLFKIELLVVDDCSTDNTITILKENHISFLSTNKNSGGPNKGRNIGLKNSTGNYICISDHDDEWKPSRLKTVLPYLEEVPIVSSGYTLIDSGMDHEIVRVNKSSSDRPHIYYKENETFLKKLTKSHQGQQAYMGSLVFKSELKQIHFEEHYGVVDFDWILRMFLNRPSIEICESLYIRYVDNENLSLDESYRIKDFDYSLRTIKEYEHMYPKETKVASRRIHGTLARFFYIKGLMKKARFYFVRSELGLKTLLYYITTFAGSSYVKKHFKVFG